MDEITALYRKAAQRVFDFFIKKDAEALKQVLHIKSISNEEGMANQKRINKYLSIPSPVEHNLSEIIINKKGKKIGHTDVVRTTKIIKSSKI